MIEQKEKSLKSLVETAIDRAKKTNCTQLVCITKKVNAHDPVMFFERAKQLHQNRTFWKSATDPFYLVSVGTVRNIQSNNKSRYETTKRQWDQLVREAIIQNPFQSDGTGLLLSGGMSFDPDRPQSSLWKKYPHSEFVIPRFTFIKNTNNYYLTTTIHVSEEDEAQTIAEHVDDQEAELFSPLKHLPEGAMLTNTSSIQPEEWKNSVQRAINEIKANRSEKIVLARELRITLNKEAEIAVIINRLLKTQPSSYVFAFERDSDCFIGATPERLVKVEKQKLLSTCLAGTAPRGKTKAEDEKNSESLFLDNKNRKEHDHVVQMIHDSIGEYCSSLTIPTEPTVLTLKNLHHLYSPVKGELKEEYTVFDVIRKLHPTPALGGVPTEGSLAFIRAHERLDRGWYGSPVGWLDSNGHGEFAVAIRSGLIQGKEASLFAGCGVMKDSNVTAEFEETNIKFLPMLTVLEENNESY